MIEIGDNTFNQKEISIPVGASVMWMSAGQKPHTVTADDGSFSSDTLKNCDMFSHTFDKPGTYAYYCKFHGGPGGQGMSGVIKVGDAAAAPAAQPAPAPAPAAAQPTVSMKDFAFEPAELHVKAGQSVVWKNDGEKRHSATAVDGSFDTGLFGKGESKTVQFNQPGTFVYFCQLHGAQDGKSGMVATIIVE
jgi:plastocyanin